MSQLEEASGKLNKENSVHEGAELSTALEIEISARHYVCAVRGYQ